MSKDLPEEFDAFVEQLSEQTTLTDRQSEVYTLRNCKYERQDVVELLDISEGAVDSHYSKAQEKVKKPGSQVQGHFYKTPSGRIPLLWDNKTTTGSYNNSTYIVSTPLLSVPKSLEQSMTNGTQVLSIYDGIDMSHPCVFTQGKSIQHIPFKTSQDLYTVFVNCFKYPVTETEAELLNGVWQVYGKSVHSSASEFFYTFFNREAPETTPKFYVELDSELRFSFLHEFYSGEPSNVKFGFELGTNRPVEFNHYTDEVNWISIVGAIGSGKSFTQDVIVSQIAKQSDVEIIEFDPLSMEGSEYVHSDADITRFDETDSGQVDDLIEEYIAYVRERLDGEGEVCLVLDEAHYLLRSHSEAFKEFVEASQRENTTLITSTQTVTEYFESDWFENVSDMPLWVFHRLEMRDEHQEKLQISERVTNLAVGSGESPYAEAILKDSDNSGLLCAVTPSTVFNIQEYYPQV